MDRDGFSALLSDVGSEFRRLVDLIQGDLDSKYPSLRVGEVTLCSRGFLCDISLVGRVTISCELGFDRMLWPGQVEFMRFLFLHMVDSGEWLRAYPSVSLSGKDLGPGGAGTGLPGI